jgi:hypothetical protein
MAIFEQPINDTRDILLADVAIKIQLSPTQYKLAVSRVETLSDWLDREDSVLRGRVKLVYAQGSMAINATIASCMRRDEFDIDAIAQLDLAPGTTPQQALDLLYMAVRGEKGSRYYTMTKRNTRCVTVVYNDMHVDLTPAELIAFRDPRVSNIFHHRPEEPHVRGERIIANPFGFAEWFTAVTPRAARFEEFFEARSRQADPILLKAETEQVPEQIPAYRKPPAVVALQLLKRNRNVRYETRSGRRPPSVFLAQRVGSTSSGTGRPFAELLFQARALRDYLKQHHDSGRLVHVTNPRCPEDVFTDRWPGTLDNQKIYLEDLNQLITQLARLEHESDLETIQEVFSRLFGEDVSTSVVREFADKSGASIASGQLRTERNTGRVSLVESGLAGLSFATTSSTRGAPRHTFFGEDEV